MRPNLSRIGYIDNIRWTMIILVVSMHAADTYSPLGNWYFVQRPAIEPATLLTFAAWQMYLQSFFMGLLFFVAGMFVPTSIDRKGPARFLRDRAFRLGLPVLFYMFVLGPVTEYYISHSWTAPYSFAHEWAHHIADLEVLQENGPLWFLLALLIFSAVYAIRYSPPQHHAPRPAPGNWTLLVFAVIMALGRFVVRGLWPDRSIFNMHIGDFSQYVLLFSAGIIAARNGWLKTFPYKRGIRWMAIVLPVGFAAWLAIVQSGPIHDGWNWRSAAFSLWESITCVAISAGLIVLYREHADGQNALTRFLSRNAFAVYVFHPPFVILGARMLWDLAWPAIPKFVLLTVLATVTTFGASELVFRRIPVLRAIL
ncbi:MAG TPA: acyltransferase family protein [Gemmatimonadaceae bacterium]|nr:acyltransferase family protein [Gemmatimonadaceae bacterium]